MNIHGPAKLNTSYKLFTVRSEGDFEAGQLLGAALQSVRGKEYAKYTRKNLATGFTNNASIK